MHLLHQLSLIQKHMSSDNVQWYLKIVARRSSQTVGSDVLLPLTTFTPSCSNNYNTQRATDISKVTLLLSTFHCSRSLALLKGCGCYHNHNALKQTDSCSESEVLLC